MFVVQTCLGQRKISNIILVYELVLFVHTLTETLHLWKSETNSLVTLFFAFLYFIYF
jgi:hypothetical protein